MKTFVKVIVGVWSSLGYPDAGAHAFEEIVSKFEIEVRRSPLA